MTINQLVIYLLPKKWGTDGSNFPKLFNEEGYFTSVEIWNKYYEGVNPLTTLNSIFETESQTYWQLSGANDYSVEVEENGNIADIRIRIDSGNYTQGGLKRILSLAHVLECNLFIPELSKLLEPNKSALEALNFLIKRSRAHKYASNS